MADREKRSSHGEIEMRWKERSPSGEDLFFFFLVIWLVNYSDSTMAAPIFSLSILCAFSLLSRSAAVKEEGTGLETNMRKVRAPLPPDHERTCGDGSYLGRG